MQISLWKYQVTKHYKCMKENWLPTENDIKAKKKRKGVACWYYEMLHGILMHIYCTFLPLFVLCMHVTGIGWVEPTEFIQILPKNRDACTSPKRIKNCRDIILFIYWFIFPMIDWPRACRKIQYYIFSRCQLKN